MPRHIIVFLLIASFGILFVGCSKPAPTSDFEEFTFTDTDLQKVQEIVTGSSESGTTTLSVASASSVSATTLIESSAASVSGASSTFTDVTVAPNTEKQQQYDNLRVSMADQSGNVYRVNNPFLNVRSSMNVSSGQVAALNQGEALVVLEIPNAQWAKVRLMDGKEGYVAMRYIAKLTTEQRLPEEKKQFEGKYFVDFAFVNLRKDASAQSEKISEIPGQTILKPLSINGPWARVAFGGREGYVATEYLKQFQPVFLVRQEDYALPIVQFHVSDQASAGALAKDIEALKAAGKKIVTLKTLYDLVLAQETRDARPSPNTVVLVVTGVNVDTVNAVGNALEQGAVNATLFLTTKNVGLSGITERVILNLMANGNELMPEGHTGDDLRSLTDSQVALELGQSKQLIEEVTKREAYATAYPTGGVNDRVMKIAAEAGYLFGLTQVPEKKFTRGKFLRLPTVYVTGATSADEVVRMVK